MSPQEPLSALYKRLSAESRLAACSYGSRAAGMLYAVEVLGYYDQGDSPAARNVGELAISLVVLAAGAGREALEMEEHLRESGGRMDRLDAALLASGFQEGERV